MPLSLMITCIICLTIAFVLFLLYLLLEKQMKNQSEVEKYKVYMETVGKDIILKEFSDMKKEGAHNVTQ